MSTSASEIEQVASLRAQLWDAGFRPVPVYNSDAPGESPGKRPWGDEWQISARRDPPQAAIERPRPEALNSGILCDGLRAIDIDIDNRTLAQRCRAIAMEMFGEAPVRIRKNSPRCLVVYRAADGMPRKQSIAGTLGKIEVLGHGNQFVAFGRHPSGADLEWFPHAPGEEILAGLPAVTEDAIGAFLAACAPIINATVRQPVNGQDHAAGDPQADPLRIAAALSAIANSGPPDWEWWNRIGMAVWRATGGSAAGWEAWNAWSARNSVHDPAAARERWDHYANSPPTSIGAGTIFMLAKAASQPAPEADPEQKTADAPNSRILSAAAFMAGFVPPDYVVDGIVQRGRLYALTSPTGHGKTAVALYKGCMVAAGRNIGGIEVTQGAVVFLAGENPDDLRCRLHAACQAYGLDPVALPLYVLPGNFPLTADAAETLKQDINTLAIDPALIVVDTAAAYFHGDDDNHNVQMGAYARYLRVLTTCKGCPAVLTPAHPVKNPDKDNLLPRGGGAFLNELDGNLTLWAATMGESATLHWQGKIRGADFAPVNFALQHVKIATLADRRGRSIMSIVATLQTDDQAEKAAKQARTDENTVLRWLQSHPGISIKDIAFNTGWVSPTGTPHKGKVHRLLKALQHDKLATLHRGKWKLTDAGKKELDA